ncbi:MAG TPA: maltose/maltodextrin ABC transporter substrate-binding protein MalE [Chthoniobacterales bacterium]
MRPSSLTRAVVLLAGLASFLSVHPVYAWKNGELLIWMDGDRGNALKPIAQKFQGDMGVKITIETPDKLTDLYPIAAQAGKGPDIVVWAHDKISEWADSGLIRSVNPSGDFKKRFLPKAWDGLAHEGQIWGYPIALETVTLLYNRKLVSGPPPKRLSELEPLARRIKMEHPGVFAVMWDYKSAYYSWGFLASGGGYPFKKQGTDYDAKDTGVDVPGAVAVLSDIAGLVNAGVLPRAISYSQTEELMGLGRLAMTVSGPWAWSNLTQKGIDFGVAPLPGLKGEPARPFVGIMTAYLNASSPNDDIARTFLEHSVLTLNGLTAMNSAKPLGVPALIELCDQLSKNDERLRDLRTCVEAGEVTPNIPQMGRFFSAVSGALEVATEGRSTPEAALKEAAASMRQN